MKKIKSETADELRPEYNRSDFGEFVRGKYANPMLSKTFGFAAEMITCTITDFYIKK